MKAANDRIEQLNETIQSLESENKSIRESHKQEIDEKDEETKDLSRDLEKFSAEQSDKLATLRAKLATALQSQAPTNTDMGENGTSKKRKMSFSDYPIDAASRKPTIQEPCHFHLLGDCRRGARCRFVHPDGDDLVRLRLELKEKKV
ncbi:hypothetical protein K491DRAFT_276170 [Lophiostoma macrostomum CBS 122681]|uniref:C3H1-type domain-containing protein n=1 Tax=Lophiostoma macrostomum CBS 122681 TaxID=1314788 RepID=A0A6A6TI40_9PLEO|nr:hypothetical protein K491DRAFT_276170 [Lophiostoma macrostomum CBS 122681]